MDNLIKSQNIAMLQKVAEGLEELTSDTVFLGGCTTALLITDTAVPDVRRTLDVDCIIDVISLNKYHQFESKLRKKGFKQSIEDEVICRWRYKDVILDVMPTDEKILGFGNRWYKQAIKSATSFSLNNSTTINVVSAPCFLATKLEAFKGRGGRDFLASHDFEDIITIIDGRPEIISDIEKTDTSMKTYFRDSFLDISNDQSFREALPGHLNYGAVRDQRVATVLNRIEQIINL